MFFSKKPWRNELYYEYRENLIIPAFSLAAITGLVAAEEIGATGYPGVATASLALASTGSVALLYKINDYAFRRDYEKRTAREDRVSE